MKKTAVDIIRQINLEVESRHLPEEMMVRDIQMMGFKIRSVIGDIALLQKLHYEFIESLWKIGKIDEIISSSFADVSEDDQERLLEYFKDVEESVQDTIRDSLELNHTHNNLPDNPILKLEIFKDLAFEAVKH
jgi:dGTP triphosphohydrolase